MGNIIDILKYVLLGLVQGIAEVLPISSSGHLTIINSILMTEDNSITLSIFLHIASLIAIIFYLRKELWIVIKGFFLYIFTRNEEFIKPFKIGVYLVISTIPLVFFALILKLLNFDDSPLWFVGVCLVINAFMLFTMGKISGTKSIDEMKWNDALVIGLMQCFGSFAGISRSGSCLCGCQIRNLKKEDSANYAFLLFVPVVIGATVLELTNIGEMVKTGTSIYLYVISFFVALITTYFSFRLLKKIIEKGSIQGFGYYCLIVGLAVFLFSIFK